MLFEDCVRNRGNEALAQLSIIAAPHSGESARDTINAFKRLANFSLLYLPESVYEQVDDDVRVRLIGSCIKNAGAGWLSAHPRQAEWLAEQGISPDEAVMRHSVFMQQSDVELQRRRNKHHAEHDSHIQRIQQRRRRRDQRPGK